MLDDSLPRPRVKVTGKDGNAFNILGIVSDALKKAGWSRAHVDLFLKEAMSGDYDNLLAVCAKYAELR